MAGGSKWDKVLDKLTNSFKNELLKIKTRQQIIKFCVENKTTRNAAEDFLKKFKKSNQKSSTRAVERKEEGNKKYNEKKYEESLLLYTESIFNASKNDECLPLAYSNRALVLQQMGCLSESLVDIDMALDNGYPTSKMGKLILRKTQCLVQLGDVEKAKEVLTQAMKNSQQKDFRNTIRKELEKIKHLKNKQDLSSKSELPEPVGGENENFVCASKHLSLHYDETRGRHVLATEDIEVGDVLFVEKPFAYVLFDKNCQNCLKAIQAPIPCWNCMDMTYCSPKCRDEFWKSVHSFECGFAELFQSVGIAHLGLRVVLNASSTLDELKKILEAIPEAKYKNGIVSYKSKEYESVYRLVHNSEKYEGQDLFQYAMTGLLLALYMKSETSYFPEAADDKELELLTSVICQHITQLVCNGHAITRDCYSKGSQDTQVGSRKLQVVNKREVRCGTAIYPSLSMLNHSCEPSIINSFQGKWIVVRAAKPIKKGEEVFNCYGPHARRMNRAARQEVLSKQYCFQCKCPACSQEYDIQDIFTAFKCLDCKGPSVPKAEKSQTTVCLSCGLTSEMSTELSNKCIKFYSLIEEGENLEEEGALKKFLEAWLLGREIFYKFHRDLGYSASEVARCLACLGDLQKSISFLKCSVRSVEVRFGSLSIELADEMKHLGDVITCYLVSCEEKEKRDMIQQGLLCYEKAQRIMKLLYGCQYEGLKEIEENRTQLMKLCSVANCVLSNSGGF